MRPRFRFLLKALGVGLVVAALGGCHDEDSGSADASDSLGTSDSLDASDSPDACVAQCEGRECGDDGCGDVCGVCDDGYQCEAGTCAFQPGCGDGTCDDTLGEDCETCSADCACDCGESCDSGACVFTACEARVCGDDRCGGSCGDCAEHHVCLDDGSCLCLPQCEDRDCGDDGCGGVCGTCQQGWQCGSSGLCDSCAEGHIDYPACVENPCLPDPCNGQGSCVDGECTCTADYHGGACEFSCSDGELNGQEWAVDCGGSCATSCEIQPLVDNSDGTVTDPNTNLIWQKTPNTEPMKVCQSMMDYSQCPSEWRDAANHCESNADGLPGEGWRLPTISELRSIVKDCENIYWNPATNTGGACGVTDDCLSYWMCSPTCEDCQYRSGPGEDGFYLDPVFDISGHNWFWSSSPSEMYIDRGWSIAFYSGLVNNNYIFVDFGVRCMREGP